MSSTRDSRRTDRYSTFDPESNGSFSNKWEIALVVIIIAAGIVITTFAAIKAKENTQLEQKLGSKVSPSIKHNHPHHPHHKHNSSNSNHHHHHQPPVTNTKGPSSSSTTSSPTPSPSSPSSSSSTSPTTPVTLPSVPLIPLFPLNTLTSSSTNVPKYPTTPARPSHSHTSHASSTTTVPTSTTTVATPPMAPETSGDFMVVEPYDEESKSVIDESNERIMSNSPFDRHDDPIVSESNDHKFRDRFRPEENNPHQNQLLKPHDGLPGFPAPNGYFFNPQYENSNVELVSDGAGFVMEGDSSQDERNAQHMVPVPVQIQPTQIQGKRFTYDNDDSMSEPKSQFSGSESGEQGETVMVVEETPEQHAAHSNEGHPEESGDGQGEQSLIPVPMHHPAPQLVLHQQFSAGTSVHKKDLNQQPQSFGHFTPQSNHGNNHLSQLTQFQSIRLPVHVNKNQPTNNNQHKHKQNHIMHQPPQQQQQAVTVKHVHFYPSASDLGLEQQFKQQQQQAQQNQQQQAASNQLQLHQLQQQPQGKQNLQFTQGGNTLRFIPVSSAPKPAKLPVFVNDIKRIPKMPQPQQQVQETVQGMQAMMAQGSQEQPSPPQVTMMMMMPNPLNNQNQLRKSQQSQHQNQQQQQNQYPNIPLIIKPSTTHFIPIPMKVPDMKGQQFIAVDPASGSTRMTLAHELTKQLLHDQFTSQSAPQPQKRRFGMPSLTRNRRSLEEDTRYFYGPGDTGLDHMSSRGIPPPVMDYTSSGLHSPPPPPIPSQRKKKSSTSQKRAHNHRSTSHYTGNTGSASGDGEDSHGKRKTFGILGSGNFEVIRGGIYTDRSGHGNSLSHSPHGEGSSGYGHKDYDDAAAGSSPHSNKQFAEESDYFTPSRDPILGFQGYDNFQSASTDVSDGPDPMILDQEKAGSETHSVRAPATSQFVDLDQDLIAIA